MTPHRNNDDYLSAFHRLTLSTVVLFAILTLSTLCARASSGEELRQESGFKMIDGVSHYYKIVGEGEPFILLHGGPGMYHDELYPFFLDFAKEHKIIFYDQRGNGKSEIKNIDHTNFTTEILVDDLESLRQAFGIDRLNIIGHSWGGLLSMHYAAKYPKNVKRLIIVASAPVNTSLLIASYKNQISRFSPEDWEYLEGLWESEAYKAGDPTIHNEAMRLSEGATFYNKAFVDTYMAAAAFDERTAKNAVALEGLATEMKRNITVQSSLSSISAPTLILQGRQDFIVPEAPQLAHKLIADSELVWIEESGHYPYIEKKEQFFSYLDAFVERTK